MEESKRSFKERLIDATHSKYGMWVLTFLSFIESAFFPIPPDFFIVPMIIARPHTWKKIAWCVSIASVLGSFLGYYIGFALFETVGQSIIDNYNLAEEMEGLGTAFNNNALWSLLVAAFTPLPYKLFTIAAGVFKVNIWIFAIASIIGRSARYILVPYLAYLGGKSMHGNEYIKKMTKWMWIGLLVIGLIIAVLVFK